MKLVTRWDVQYYQDVNSAESPLMINDPPPFTPKDNPLAHPLIPESKGASLGSRGEIAECFLQYFCILSSYKNLP